LQGFAGQFAGEYIRDTVGIGNFCVGEFWADLSYGDGGLEYNQDAARQALCDYLDQADGVMALFDFPTKGILQEAVNGELWRLADANRKPPGLIGWWPKRAVTFIDNHDTGTLCLGSDRVFSFIELACLICVMYMIIQQRAFCKRLSMGRSGGWLLKTGSRQV
jgi:hypothetical protein